MLVQQSNPVTPLTPVSTPPGGHASDLSPRSSNSSYASNDSILNQSSIHSATKENVRGRNSPDDFSALQRLQFALERNALFSTLLNEHDGSQPSRLVKPCQSSSNSSLPDSPEEKPHNVHNVAAMTNGIRTPASSPDDSTNTANIIFQCPLCSVVCNSRHEFNEHLVTHSQQHACPRCPYLTDNEDSLKAHLQESHDVSDFEVLTDDEVRTPKTNSQGKTKMFKCKQCGYSAETKLDFWEHTKTHIRQEKMLTCPKCPFVTEYKHHLEYHLRNHFGSKPFQCNKCAYSCVNKSMLNSHLKSHSTIYQYRCADCSYATKYCHSLKLHLRKYDHKPSMVLNPDGTPNPLPIIDVYGTRRGPKIKRQQDQNGDDTCSEPASPTLKEKTPKKQKDLKRQAESNEVKNRSSNNNCSTPPVSPQFPAYEIKREFGSPHLYSPNNPRIDEISNSINNGMRTNVRFQQVQPTMQIPMTTVNPATAFQLQNLIMQNTANKATMEMMMKNPMEAYAAALNHYMLSNPALHVSSPLELTKMAEEQQRVKMFSQILHRTAMATQAQVAEVPRRIVNPQPLDLNIQAPLDLRNPKAGGDNQVEEFNEDMKKRKRKGKALRYDRRKEIKRELDGEDSNEVLDFSNNNNNNNNNIKMPNLVNRTDGENESLVCKYCDISFPPVLYSLHMRFHSSDSDPFRCNVCGTRSAEKVSFFVHLATASH